MSGHRYRLRFLLQEVDLAFGETLIGRSPECRVTIEDPLVSRVHARVVVGPDGVHVDDTGSRNGVRVNGKLVKGPTPLTDGDRIRVGTQDFVFCVVATRDYLSDRRKTGALRVCLRCRTPYAAEVGACTSCGATEPVNEDTVSADHAGGVSKDWGILLLVEVLERCIAGERWPDADRLARRVIAAVEDHLAAGHSVERTQLDRVGHALLRLAIQEESANRLVWLFGRYSHEQLPPPLELLAGIEQLPSAERARIARAAGSVWEAVRSRSDVVLAQGDEAALASLAALRESGGDAR
jgi:pSer/pThr/pTyr-binding forkhead associated (FHA) protein